MNAPFNSDQTNQNDPVAHFYLQTLKAIPLCDIKNGLRATSFGVGKRIELYERVSSAGDLWLTTVEGYGLPARPARGVGSSWLSAWHDERVELYRKDNGKEKDYFDAGKEEDRITEKKHS